MGKVKHSEKIKKKFKEDDVNIKSDLHLPHTKLYSKKPKLDTPKKTKSSISLVSIKTPAFKPEKKLKKSKKMNKLQDVFKLTQNEATSLLYQTTFKPKKKLIKPKEVNTMQDVLKSPQNDATSLLHQTLFKPKKKLVKSKEVNKMQNEIKSTQNGATYQTTFKPKKKLIKSKNVNKIIPDVLKSSQIESNSLEYHTTVKPQKKLKKLNKMQDALKSTKRDTTTFNFVSIQSNGTKRGRFVRQLLNSPSDDEDSDDDWMANILHFQKRLLKKGAGNMKVTPIGPSPKREVPKSKKKSSRTSYDINKLPVESIHKNRIIINETTEIELKDEDYTTELNSEGSFIEQIPENSDLLNTTDNQIIPTGNYAQYPCSSNGAIITIDENSTIYFHGMMSLKVLYGSVEVLGSNLDASSPSHEIFSPRGSAFLSLRNLNAHDRIKKEILFRILMRMGVVECDVREIVEKHIKPGGLILFCDVVSNHRIEFLEANCAQILYPPQQNGLRAIIRNYVGSWSVYKQNERWDTIVRTMQVDSLVMLCGGKGVGKSTLLRYLINRLLGRFDEVIVVDLDPGQPEFTVSGCISVTTVTKPVFGPNYTHLQQPDRSIFVPHIDISANHSIYLECVKELVKDLSARNTKPTIVNYMGYSKQLGLNMAASVISIVKPTTVVQLQSTHASRNFAVDLTASNVCHYKYLLTPNSDDNFKCEFVKIKSMTRNAGPWELEPRQVRELLTLSYLSAVLPKGCLFLTMREVNICRTKLDSITITCNGMEVDPMTINACLVALCSTAKAKGDNRQEIYNCHGYGLVRAVNPMRNYLDLLTPACIDDLNATTHLVMGSVGVPPAIYLRHDSKIKGHVPYTFKGELSTFARLPKRAIVPKK